MRNIAIVVALVIPLAGCGIFERMSAGITGWSRICVEGVAYLQFASGATVEYTREGKVKLCDD